MKTLLLSLSLTFSLSAIKESDKEQREIKRLRKICYKVAAVSAASSFAGGTMAAWLFYYIQSRREQ